MDASAIVWKTDTFPSPTAKFVALALAKHADAEGFCYPSHRKIANLTGFTRKTVTNAMAALEAGGFIRRRETRRDDGSRGTDDIVFTLAPVEIALDPVGAAEGWGRERRTPPPREAASEGVGKDVLRGGAAATQHNPSGEQTNGTRASSEALAPVPVAASPERQAFDHWNVIAEEHGWTLAKVFNPARKRALTARLRECDGIAGWRDAVTRCVLSPFLSGRTSGKFEIRLDFLLQPSSFTKLLEGYYDHRRPDTASGDPGGRAANHDRRTDAMLAGAASAFGAHRDNS